MSKRYYIVEVREATRGGDDYTEDTSDELETPEQVRSFIASRHEDEQVHSVLFYKDDDSDPKDVTKQFPANSRKRH
jgi:hypothetical protein